MKICVVGAGAIGGLLAAKLHKAGEDVTVIARGPHLAAIRERGLKLIEEGKQEIVAPLVASDRIGEVRVQDLVVLGVKAHQLEAVVRDLPVMCGPETVVLSAQNGIPWWYFLKHGGPYEGKRLDSVDPGGVIASNLPAERVIGGVVYPAAEIIAPGVIKHIEGNRLSLAEIDGAQTPRLKLILETFRGAGFKATPSSDIRSEIWMKLWGNVSFNPISALTHATLQELCQFPLTRTLVADMMRETQAIAQALGIRLRVSIEQRIAGGEAVGQHKTSMLQDVEAGRVMETEALIGSVVELGRVTGQPTPHIDAVYALVKLLSQILQSKKGRLRITPV